MAFTDGTRWFGKRRRELQDGERSSVLQLVGAQLMATSFEDDELVLDLFGGEGVWRTVSADERVTEQELLGCPTLTLRANLRDTIDIDLLDRISGWCHSSKTLLVTIELDGDDLAAPGRRWSISDGTEALTVMAA